MPDMNECAEFPQLCQNGSCRNTLGNFICTCNDGYDLDGMGVNCVDIDECSISSNICGNGVVSTLQAHLIVNVTRAMPAELWP